MDQLKLLHGCGRAVLRLFIGTVTLVVMIFTTGCSQPSTPPRPSALETSRLPLYDNLGSLHHPITTVNPEAQRYFDQGLRLVYGFNHEEAIRAFEEVVRLDPSAAMGYWGIALALGPNINAPMDRQAEQRAFETIQQALRDVNRVSAADREYIEALAVRYAETSANAAGTRKDRDLKYAEAMRRLSQSYPDDADAVALFAEALMNLRPWDLWLPDGQPQPGTLELLTVLEHLLERQPDHPGACHFYIHSVEASPHPERALRCAERLPSLMPGAGHLVHMPAHIYMRVGLYEKVAERNTQAVAVDEHYLGGHNIGRGYALHYYPHNIHFLWAARVMQGRSQDAVKAARDLVGAVPVEGVLEEPALEVFTAAPLQTFVRFARWDDILREPVPASGLVYTTVIWHYARGLALVANAKLEEAAAEHADAVKLMEAMSPDRAAGNSSAKQLSQIATLVLAGQIAAKERRYDRAVQHLTAAVAQEDQLRYNEPEDWYYPVRQSLGTVLLRIGRAEEAEMVFRQDLKRHPHNGWSLDGLRQALAQRNRLHEAEGVLIRFRQAWTAADVSEPSALEAFQATPRP
jgi:tetratricopeptide (TPR) repeat protein